MFFYQNPALLVYYLSSFIRYLRVADILEQHFLLANFLLSLTVLSWVKHARELAHGGRVLSFEE